MHSIKDVCKDDSHETSECVAQNEEAVRGEVQDLAAKYAGKSEAELINTLMQTVNSAKADGSFSAESLDEFVGFVSPGLDEQARARLMGLVNMIKNG